MDQHLPILAKKVWSLMHVAIYMLRKGIPKRRLLLEFNTMIKRGKIARKALQKLMFHHHNTTINRQSPPNEYEFSCSNSPCTYNHTFLPFSIHKKQHFRNQHGEDADIMALNDAVLKEMEMVNSEAVSLVLPGFGRSPVVRQLRVTDSPFPVSNVDEDRHVDEAAERFIRRFYDDLRRQNNKGTFGSVNVCDKRSKT